MEGPTKFPALYSRDFRLFWIGQLISYSGTWMHSTAQGWLVYSLTGSPLYLGLVSTASSLPILFFSLLGGVAADRFRKRSLIIVTQALSILPALLIGVLTSLGKIQVWHVIVLVSFLGVVNSFDVPARQSFIAEMVERGRLLNAVALNSAAFNGARIIGPIIAGLTIAHVGIAACFYLNAFSFVPILVALYMIRSRGEVRTGGGGFMRELAEGMSFIRNEPGVLRPMVMVSVFSLLSIPFISLLPIFADKILAVGAKGLGYLAGAMGVGAFSAAMLLSFKGDIRKKAGLMAASSILFPASLVAFSVSRNFHLSLALLAVAGWSVVSFLALANTSIQMAAPDNLRGRVMSVYTLLFLGMTPIGYLLAGSAADFIGTANAVLVTSSVCLIVSVSMKGGKSS